MPGEELVSAPRPRGKGSRAKRPADPEAHAAEPAVGGAPEAVGRAEGAWIEVPESAARQARKMIEKQWSEDRMEFDQLPLSGLADRQQIVPLSDQLPTGDSPIVSKSSARFDHSHLDRVELIRNPSAEYQAQAGGNF